MKPAHLFFFAAVIAVASLQAQVTIQPEGVTTDTVNLFENSQKETKSPGAAIVASLVLPGLGHQYVGRNRTALTFLSVEAASIFAFFFCDQYANRIATNSAGYAWVHSGAQGTITDADDYYWKLVGNFMDTHEYNMVMELNRTPEKSITDEARVWHWDDQSSQDHYNAQRNRSRSYRILSTFFIGALVLNRVVAFIDIRNQTRDHGVRRAGISRFELLPVVSATPTSFDCSLSGSF